MKVLVKDAVVQRFLSICESRGITSNELAVMSGVTPSTVYSMLDSRRRNLQIATIKILCDGLDMTLAEFFDAPEFNTLEQEIR